MNNAYVTAVICACDIMRPKSTLRFHANHPTLFQAKTTAHTATQPHTHTQTQAHTHTTTHTHRHTDTAWQYLAADIGARKS